MSEYLTGDQIARLKALEMVARHSNSGTVAEAIVDADRLARFIMNGEVPTLEAPE